MEVVSSTELAHLRRELTALRQEKDRLRTELATKVAAEKERTRELQHFKLEHERQLRQVKKEAHVGEVRENKQLSLLQKTIQAKEKVRFYTLEYFALRFILSLLFYSAIFFYN